MQCRYLPCCSLCAVIIICMILGKYLQQSILFRNRGSGKGNEVHSGWLELQTRKPKRRPNSFFHCSLCSLLNEREHESPNHRPDRSEGAHSFFCIVFSVLASPNKSHRAEYHHSDIHNNTMSLLFSYLQLYTQQHICIMIMIIIFTIDSWMGCSMASYRLLVHPPNERAIFGCCFFLAIFLLMVVGHEWSKVKWNEMYWNGSQENEMRRKKEKLENGARYAHKSKFHPKVLRKNQATTMVMTTLSTVARGRTRKILRRRKNMPDGKVCVLTHSTRSEKKNRKRTTFSRTVVCAHFEKLVFFFLSSNFF